MKPGDRVLTPDGPGTIVRQEGKEGILSKRFEVKLDEYKYTRFPPDMELCYFDTELKKIE